MSLSLKKVDLSMVTPVNGVVVVMTIEGLQGFVTILQDQSGQPYWHYKCDDAVRSLVKQNTTTTLPLVYQQIKIISILTKKASVSIVRHSQRVTQSMPLASQVLNDISMNVGEESENITSFDCTIGKGMLLNEGGIGIYEYPMRDPMSSFGVDTAKYSIFIADMFLKTDTFLTERVKTIYYLKVQKDVQSIGFACQYEIQYNLSTVTDQPSQIYYSKEELLYLFKKVSSIIDQMLLKSQNDQNDQKQEKDDKQDYLGQLSQKTKFTDQ